MLTPEVQAKIDFLEEHSDFSLIIEFRSATWRVITPREYPWEVERLSGPDLNEILDYIYGVLVSWYVNQEREAGKWLSKTRNQHDRLLTKSPWREASDV